MLQIKPSKNTVIILGLIAVVLFIGCGFTYFNRASKFSMLEAQIQEKEKKLADSEQIAKRLYTVEGNYLDVQAQLGVLERGVSTRAYVPTLLRQIEELAKSLKLRVVSVRPRPRTEIVAPSSSEGKKGETKKVEPYDKLDIDIEVNGKYWDAVSFIHRLTSFPKIIAVTDVQMSPVDQTEKLGSPTLSIRLSTTAFVLKEPIPLAPKDRKGSVGAGEGKEPI
jgi:Tfp pilus assembly protein PilO